MSLKKNSNNNNKKSDSNNKPKYDTNNETEYYKTCDPRMLAKALFPNGFVTGPPSKTTHNNWIGGIEKIKSFEVQNPPKMKIRSGFCVVLVWCSDILDRMEILKVSHRSKQITNFTGIEFIKNLTKNKGIENNGKMMGGTIFTGKQVRSVQQENQHGQLVCCLD